MRDNQRQNQSHSQQQVNQTNPGTNQPSRTNQSSQANQPHHRSSQSSRFNQAHHRSGLLSDGRYVYHTATGEPIYIMPGEVSQDVILMLTDMDHNEALGERYTEENRSYWAEHVKQKAADDNDSTDNDPFDCLPDPAADVFEAAFGDEEEPSGLAAAFEQVRIYLTPQQIDFIYDHFGLRLTLEEIARRDGVTPQAIQNRKKKIIARIRKLMTELGEI